MGPGDGHGKPISIEEMTVAMLNLYAALAKLLPWEELKVNSHAGE